MNSLRKMLQIICVLALCSLILAASMDFNRLKTDKKAMRNSLVRFGKRNFYRPSGEAFVGAFDGGNSRGGLEAFESSSRFPYALPILRYQRRQMDDADDSSSAF
uniref:Uncharacterized protein n=1 Tax=Ditylenchus dipsaci TaxID=166011 RepID=A0A915EA08_9BILA